MPGAVDGGEATLAQLHGEGLRGGGQGGRPPPVDAGLQVRRCRQVQAVHAGETEPLAGLELFEHVAHLGLVDPRGAAQQQRPAGRAGVLRRHVAAEPLERGHPEVAAGGLVGAGGAAAVEGLVAHLDAVGGRVEGFGGHAEVLGGTRAADGVHGQVGALGGVDDAGVPDGVVRPGTVRVGLRFGEVELGPRRSDCAASAAHLVGGELAYGQPGSGLRHACMQSGRDDPWAAPR